MEWGADIVVHSATKYIDGHGTSIGGVAVDSGTFDWSNGRFPSIAEPSAAYHGLAFHETFGVYGFLMKLRAETLRDLGAALSPFTAFLYALGLETLPVRMDRHVANALAVARYLEGHPMVERVRYAGLESSPYLALAQRYLPRGAGAVFACDLRGGREAGQRFIESLRLWSHLANVGDAKSLVIHPASTTHRQLSDEELPATGVTPGTVRLSVGLETPDDLIWDLERGLRAVERLVARQSEPAAAGIVGQG
jgi:O-acetylhomoserine (thiol)-lyase